MTSITSSLSIPPHQLAACWLADTPLSLIKNLCPAGSPERAVKRFVLYESEKPSRRYVLEGVQLARAQARELQARTLLALQQAGCQNVAPWLPLPDGRLFLAGQDGLVWQLRRYVPGILLPRLEYGDHAWRGEALGEALAGWQSAAETIQLPWSSFSVSDYLQKLLPAIASRLPSLADDLRPVLAELAEFRAAEPALPCAFAHGDFHPLNVLWSSVDIRAAIDWEFMGRKIAAYDAANLLGCLGNDDPRWLNGPCALAFLEHWTAQRPLTPEMLHFLPELVVAVRFGWMREWCWKDKREMIVQELDFIWLVLDNRELLRKRWGAVCQTQPCP